MRKIFIFIFLFVIALISFYFLNQQGFFQDTFVYNHQRKESANQLPPANRLTLMAVGDIMLGRSVYLKLQKYGQEDFCFPFLLVKDYLKEADILFGNLEGPISERGERVGSIYSFRFKPQSIDGLQCAGFDILSLANNHMFDYQRIALEDTFGILRNNEIFYVGAGQNKEEAFSLRVIEKNGTKIGFLAFIALGPKNWRAGENYAGMAWIEKDDFPLISETIGKAKEEVDILAVSSHFGVEYQPLPDEFQKDFSQMAIESGADLVLGHHPHVIQPLEKYNNGWIIYSLGNFVFDQYFSKETMEGGILKVEIVDKKISNVVLNKVQLNEFYQPELVLE